MEAACASETSATLPSSTWYKDQEKNEHKFFTPLPQSSFHDVTARFLKKQKENQTNNSSPFHYTTDKNLLLQNYSAGTLPLDAMWRELLTTHLNKPKINKLSPCPLYEISSTSLCLIVIYFLWHFLKCILRLNEVILKQEFYYPVSLHAEAT
jgi:hypothetical protein